MIYYSVQPKGILYYDSDTGRFWREFAKGTRKDFKALNSAGYIKIQFNGRLERGHRIAWYMVYGRWPTEIDHINRVKDDNRISNLREVTSQENQRNKAAKGFCFDKQRAANGLRPWRAYICQDYKLHHLGYFWTEEVARAAYLQARKDLGWDS